MFRSLQTGLAFDVFCHTLNNKSRFLWLRSFSIALLWLWLLPPTTTKPDCFLAIARPFRVASFALRGRRRYASVRACVHAFVCQSIDSNLSGIWGKISISTFLHLWSVAQSLSSTMTHMLHAPKTQSTVKWATSHLLSLQKHSRLIKNCDTVHRWTWTRL